MSRKPPDVDSGLIVLADLRRRGRPRRVRRRRPALPGWGARARLRRAVLALLAAVLLTIVPVLVLRFVPAWTSSFMVGYQVDRLANPDLAALQHRWVPWEEIAPVAGLAVIAAEDQRFPDHFGLDLVAINKALEHNREGGRTRGASTISQQVAKNLFLWQGRSWVRKGLELGYTLLIEILWSKQRILEVYLNSAEFGEGIYGVEAAARFYFGKPAARLSEYEAALLAAVLPSPRRYRVSPPSPYVSERAAWIQGQMRQLGQVTLDRL
ncbi:monofunctional biosynthetic peptidoglycan transglycosylase [Polycyclovorans algicola]|jgi:monofunctional glycosyltransferase|uniref:monofunctional biosynthetic peptidoglycan transglycosylase n=1 Tax=Polycyclovorans algicola TaxID=616992 RepID=UPI000A048BA0|nr:monofunctional biosynthetic peptidoglycan transglycosylase [Polycyclovorans algicola]